MTMAQIRGRSVTVERWPTELPLQALCVLASVALYALLAVTVIGLIYAAALALFFFVAHAVFMAYVRGSAVKLGPDQFPDLHRRVTEIAQRIGLDPVPDAYLMQAGGALNAFATRFLGSDVIVLFSDLLDACGDNAAARDMIIAHELGHHRAGHLRLRWLLAPGMAIPFLGGALSRAREYTCDRYGLAGAGDRDGASLGLTILAAGGKYAPQVNRQAMVRQREDLNTGWITIGEWLSSHPPLVKRIAALDPTFRGQGVSQVAGKMRALAIVGGFFVVVLGGGVWAAAAIPGFLSEVERQGAAASQPFVTDSVPLADTLR
jgi:Zn-dependent protease with chaperone function